MMTSQDIKDDTSFSRVAHDLISVRGWLVVGVSLLHLVMLQPI